MKSRVVSLKPSTLPIPFTKHALFKSKFSAHSCMEMLFMSNTVETLPWISEVLSSFYGMTEINTGANHLLVVLGDLLLKIQETITINTYKLIILYDGMMI